jgi:hypothetical protein
MLKYISVSKIKSKVMNVLLYVLSFMCFCYSYQLFVSPIFSYAGFTYNFNGIKFSESLFFVCLLALILPSKYEKPSDFLLHFYFVFPVLPMLALYSCKDESRYFFYLIVSSFIFISITSTYLKTSYIKSFYFNLDQCIKLLLLISYCCIFYILLKGGVGNINFDISKVYEYRSDSSSMLPGVFGYLSPWVSKIFLPMCMIFSIVKRNFIFFTLGFFGCILMFSVTHHKTTLLMPFFVTSVYFFLNTKSPVKYFLLFLLVIISLPIMLYTMGIFKELTLIANSFLLRRTFFVPAMMNFDYFTFFSTNPFTFWADSKLTFDLISSPYDKRIPFIIGERVHNSIDMSANTGWLGSGFAQAGVLGVSIYTLLISAIMLFVNSLSRKIDKSVVTAIFIPLFFAFYLSSDLITTFFTHGLFIQAIILIHVKQSK